MMLLRFDLVLKRSLLPFLQRAWHQQQDGARWDSQMGAGIPWKIHGWNLKLGEKEHYLSNLPEMHFESTLIGLAIVMIQPQKASK